MRARISQFLSRWFLHRTASSFLYTNSIDGLVVVKQGRIIECNDAALRMTGARSRSEILLLTPAQLSPDFQSDGSPSAQRAAALAAKAVAEGPQSFEWRRRRLDGSEFDAHITLIAGNLHGVPVMYAQWRDITELTVQREQLVADIARQKQRVEATQLLDTSVQAICQTLSCDARRMADEASELRHQADASLADGETAAQAMANVQEAIEAIGVASEQLNSSSRDIALRSSHSVSETRDIARLIREAEQSMADLAKATQEVGGVLGQINAIAQQTNLLALNANIEAARAGDAGRGFAIVAQEVKQLAAQTMAAVSSVEQFIARIQAAGTQNIEAVSSAASAAGRVEGNATEVSVAVEQQSSATDEIVTRLLDAQRTGAAALAGIKSLVGTLERGSANAALVVAASTRVGTQAGTLSSSMNAFTIEGR
jgi:methyl-accepting chemotaxis protein